MNPLKQTPLDFCLLQRLIQAITPSGFDVGQLPQLTALQEQNRRLQLEMETPEEIEYVVSRLLEILETKQKGVFCHAVPEIFAGAFSSDLPENWRVRIEGNPRLEVRSNGLADVLYERTSPYVVPRVQEARAARAPIPITNQIRANQCCGQVDQERPHKSALELNSFYSQELIARSLRLEDSDEVSVGTLYAVFDCKWCRVKCVKLGSDSEPAQFRFVDREVVRSIPKDELHHLPEEFYP